MTRCPMRSFDSSHPASFLFHENALSSHRPTATFRRQGKPSPKEWHFRNPISRCYRNHAVLHFHHIISPVGQFSERFSRSEVVSDCIPRDCFIA
jgi:hypothetical protein